MHHDDRLATVLHHRAAGERAARVQFRQLLDLLGQPTEGTDPGLIRAAYRRLDALSLMIPIAQRERVASECSARIRNPRLIAWFAGTEPQLAIAALSRALLDEQQWTALIPELPIRARGLLRHRRNLPVGAQILLDRLGVHDRALPEPEDPPVGSELGPLPKIEIALPALDLGASPREAYLLDEEATEVSGEGPDADSAPIPDPVPARATLDEAVIDTGNLGALVRRIEAFQRARAQRAAATTPDAPRLPLGGEAEDDQARAAIESFLFTTDTEGRIDWAEAAAAPLVVGTLLAAPGAVSPEGFAAGFAQHRPVTSASIALGGGEAISGSWIVEAAPRFTPRSGTFIGYIGRFRRPAAVADTRAARAADRIRQLLHELRTPVTAIQGFAEVIQQQTVGPVPHEYRALAAAIAGDAARMLAGFVELERFARLEAGTQEFPEGTADFAIVARRQIAQLQTVLSPRVSRLEATWQVSEARVPLAPETAEMLAWRFLGTLAAATAAGERIAIELAAAGDMLRLTVALPAALAQIDDIFAGDIRANAGALGTGLFGAGFALRLARAEARAAGGDLLREEPGSMVLFLPLGQAHAAPIDEPHDTAARIDRNTAAARLP